MSNSQEQSKGQPLRKCLLEESTRILGTRYLEEEVNKVPSGTWDGYEPAYELIDSLAPGAGRVARVGWPGTTENGKNPFNVSLLFDAWVLLTGSRTTNPDAGTLVDSVLQNLASTHAGPLRVREMSAPRVVELACELGPDPQAADNVRTAVTANGVALQPASLDYRFYVDVAKFAWLKEWTGSVPAAEAEVANLQSEANTQALAIFISQTVFSELWGRIRRGKLTLNSVDHPFLQKCMRPGAPGGPGRSASSWWEHYQKDRSRATAPPKHRSMKPTPATNRGLDHFDPSDQHDQLVRRYPLCLHAVSLPFRDSAIRETDAVILLGDVLDAGPNFGDWTTDNIARVACGRVAPRFWSHEWIDRPDRTIDPTAYRAFLDLVRDVKLIAIALLSHPSTIALRLSPSQGEQVDHWIRSFANAQHTYERMTS